METPDGTAAAPFEAAPEAPAEAVEAPVAEAPAPEEAAPVAEPEFDSVSAVFGEGSNEVFDAHQAKLDKEGWDSFKVAKEDFERLLQDPTAGQVLVNYRNLAQRKADDAARAEQAVVERQQELDQRAAEMEQEKARMWAMFQDPRLKDQVKPPEGEKPDMYTNPEAFAEWVADKRFADRMGKFLEDLGAISDEAQQKVQATMVEANRAKAKTELRAFVEQQADFFDYGDEIEALVKQGIKAERAYWMVKGEKMARGEIEAPANKLEQVPPDPRRAMRPTARSNGSNGLPATPDLTGMELQQWYDANPGTRARDAAQWKKHGMSW